MKSVSSASHNTQDNVVLLNHEMLYRPQFQDLLWQLQRTLEPSEQLNIFFETLQQELSPDSLQYEQDDIYISLGQSARHSCDYALHTEFGYLGRIMLTRRKRFSEDELLQLELSIRILVQPLRNALMYRQACRSAMEDPLTGVGNRMALNKAMTRELAVARRHGHPLSVLMVDIDHFKRINDTHGHDAGDIALASVARAMQAALRDMDSVFRYGGEEFTILLPATDINSASLVGERLRKTIAGLECHYNGCTLNLTVSIGAAQALANDNNTNLINRADSALYEAKHSGRNRLCLAS